MTSPAPCDDLRRMRHLVASACERLRSLDLPPGDARTAAEVACTALGALSTVLFVSGDAVASRIPPGLVEDEITQIVGLLGVEVAVAAGAAADREPPAAPAARP